jgi:DNA-binding GntR family transcriptional regulator
VVGRAVEQVGVVLADEDDARDLEIAQSIPLLRLDRRIFSNREHVLEWRVGRCFLRNEQYLVKFN